jgi:hypothetical protein
LGRDVALDHVVAHDCSVTGTYSLRHAHSVFNALELLIGRSQRFDLKTLLL